MGKRIWLFLACSYCFLFCAAPSSARLLENWSYERLFKESDLVVMGAASATKDSRDSIIDERWPLELVGRNTTFKVRHVLKGSIKKKEIILLYYRFGKAHNKGKQKDGDPEEIIDGPGFVSFYTKPTKIDIAGWEGYKVSFEYLLFLKKRCDGRYEPVSGPIDPGLSIREILPPFFSEGKAHQEIDKSKDASR